GGDITKEFQAPTYHGDYPPRAPRILSGDGDLYFIDDGALRRLRGPALPTIPILDGNVIDDGGLAYTVEAMPGNGVDTRFGGHVVRFNLQTGAKTALAVGSLEPAGRDTPNRLAVDARDVWFTDGGGRRLWRVPKDASGSPVRRAVVDAGYAAANP